MPGTRGYVESVPVAADRVDETWDESVPAHSIPTGNIEVAPYEGAGVPYEGFQGGVHVDRGVS